MKNTEIYSAKSIKWLPMAYIYQTLIHDKAYLVCLRKGENDYYLPTTLQWNSRTSCFHELGGENEEDFGDMQFAGKNNLLMVAEIVLPA